MMMIPTTTTLVRSILLLPVSTSAFTPTSRLLNLLPNTTPLAPKSYHFSSTPKTTITPTNMDTTTNSNNDMKEKLFKKCYGGDYAGHSATFSPTDGKLVPIPEYYVPETLIEWGQIPSCFELLTSEDYVDTGKEPQVQLNRVGIKVLPAVGCGIDNLDTLVQRDSIGLSSYQAFESSDDDGIVSSSSLFVHEKTDSKSILETIFVPKSSGAADKEEKENESFPYRIRVRITMDSPQQQVLLKAPIEITVERKTSVIGSEGKVIDGGGLTGSTIFELIGPNVNKPFSNGQGIELDRLVGGWTMGPGNVEERDSEGYWNDDNMCTLSLPGNVIVRYTKIVEGEERTFPWTVEISLVEDDGREGTAIRRRVIQRIFKEDGGTTVHYWEEGQEA